MTDKEKQRELIVEIMKADEESGLYPTMKQTAVDYLFEKLWDEPKDKFTWYKIAGDAKDMEKEQIKEAYDAGVWEVGCRNADSEEYYKETYE
tara:strand:- start:501 stop:776 length:276 start_codon:yes stop_codon:yes gene_type:complete